MEDINITEIKNFYSDIINPIDDQRSTSLYRKEVSLNLLEQFLISILN